jgi:hypothetical protein
MTPGWTMAIKYLHAWEGIGKESALVVGEKAQRETKDKDGYPMVTPNLSNRPGDL